MPATSPRSRERKESKVVKVKIERESRRQRSRTRSRSRSRSRDKSRHLQHKNAEHTSGKRHSSATSHQKETYNVKHKIKEERITPERCLPRQMDVRSDARDRYRDERHRNDERRVRDKRQKKADREEDDSQHVFGQPVKEETTVNAEDKQKPNFELSGKLAEDTNTFRGVVIKYNEPPEARIPKRKWRLYPFKGQESMPVLHLHRQSGYLFGRDRKVADVPVDHPSCSKQHAVLQFRSVAHEKPDGSKGRRTTPYIIDLGSANGTYVNNVRIDSQRYVELFEKDTLKFGFSTRDYVLMHDSMDVTEADDEPDPPV